MNPTPKRLILNLLVALGNQPLGAREAVRACGLFGVSENNTRVALARLSAEELVASPRRGQYQLTDRALELADDIRSWRHSLQRLIPWQGDWLAVHCGNLGRSDRAALRLRERALELNGFRQLEKGLFVRPDNLKEGVSGVRERLYKLGLERQAAVFQLRELDPSRREQALALWPTAQLVQAYQDSHDELQRWLERADQLDPEDAARESFLIGDQAIRQMVFDPLLPELMIDARARQAFFKVLLRYDQVGHQLWRQLYLSMSASRAAS